MYGVGLILGAGIYVLIGEAAGLAGDAVWISITLGTIVAVFAGLSYAELSSVFPKAAAEYTFVKNSFKSNFLGHAPEWYKLTIIGFLILNPLLNIVVGPFITGWLLIAEFIFTLAMALKCYPLQPGGLLALEAILLGMSTPHAVFSEAINN